MNDDHITVVPADFLDAILDSPPARNEDLTRAAQQNRDIALGNRITPAEWVRRWDNLTPEQRLKCAEHILNGAEQAYRCCVMDHEGRIEELEAASNRNAPPAWQGEHLDPQAIESIAAQIAMRRRIGPPAGPHDGEARP